MSTDPSLPPHFTGVCRPVCILLMHAGGFSKRLPQVSVVGKIFTTLPMAFGEAVFTMFEINLASYIEFPSHMVPGVSACPLPFLLPRSSRHANPVLPHTHIQ